MTNEDAIDKEPCIWCEGKYSRSRKLKPCGNGDFNLEYMRHTDGIVILEYGSAMGYFAIKYCPECGRKLTIDF